MDDTVKVESLTIKVDDNLTLNLSPSKAKRLRDALCEIFPAANGRPFIFWDPINDWPYLRWSPYVDNQPQDADRFTWSDTAAPAMYCSLED